jgi:septal ring factor EnvC (AmiA/AmiB activator)
MKLIKKYWLVIAGAIATIIGFITLSNTKSKNVKIIDKKIKDNKKEIDVLEEKIEVIEKTRVKTNKKIVKQEVVIEALETKKENIVVEDVPINEAKANIIAKTGRGRKSKK